MRKVIARGGFLSLVLSLLAVGLAPQSGASAAAGNTRLCIYSKPKPGQTNEQAISSLEKKVFGNTTTQFAVHKHFVWWDDPWPATQEAEDAKKGRHPMIDWKPTFRNGTPAKWKDIAAGKYDSILKTRAAALKKYNRHVYFSFHHEPENDTATHGTASEFIAAFKHIKYVFQDVVGIPSQNITWVEALMAQTFAQGKQDTWYAGSKAVEMMGLNGYNWYPGKPKAKWRNLYDIFKTGYNWSVSKGEPVMITETGVLEDPKWTGGGNRKADWFNKALATMKGWPKLKVFCYWHSDVSYPWWIDTSTAALKGYQTLAKDGWMIKV